MEFDTTTLRKVYLHRYMTSDQGTCGVLTDDWELSKHIIELPWRNNIPNLSCIPHGKYIAVPHKYRGYRSAYKLLDVPGRSSILIHNGCFAGNKEKGYKTHSAGCLIIGNYVGRIGNQKAVLSSRVGLREFVSYMNNEIFLLSIEELKKISMSKKEKGGRKL
jgi:hypothetical protein